MNDTIMPPLVQAVGLACVPVHDMPPHNPALARRPVAAAVITLKDRGDGYRDVVATPLSEAHGSGSSQPWLIDRTLVAGGATIITPEDATILSVEAMARRSWAEPQLAALAYDITISNPPLGGSDMVRDEAAFCRRLQIPTSQVRDTDVERAWSCDKPGAAIDVALAIAVGRLMLWAHGMAFASGEPDAFYETLLPLRDWMAAERERAPSLERALRSRPVARATALASAYRAYRAARDAGEPVRWGDLGEGLFHS